MASETSSIERGLFALKKKKKTGVWWFSGLRILPRGSRPSAPGGAPRFPVVPP